MKTRQSDIRAVDRYLNPLDEAPNEGGNGADAEASRSRKPVDEDELYAYVAAELQDAVGYIDLEIGPDRAEAIKAYRGDPYGDEEEGKSTVVSRDVHDTVQGQLPDLIRILLGPERICEFAAERAEDVDWVAQATKYAEYIMERDNDGFSILYSSIKDALTCKVGIVKFWWDDTEEVRTEHYSGLDELGIFVLEQDGTVEDMEMTELEPNPQLPPDPRTGQPPKLYDVTVKRHIKNGRVKLASLPLEEFIIDRRARSIEDASLCGHRSMPTVSDLVSMGYDEDMVREYIGSSELDTNVEYVERQPHAMAVGSFDILNPSSQRVLYVEAYLRIDFDGDGIAELTKICTMGSGYKVVHHEPVDHVPFADFHVDPEPHTFFGFSTADKTLDIQKIKTHIQRNVYDSLAQSIHVRMGVVEGEVNMDDVLNNEVGGPIRMRAPGMVQPFDTPFVGMQAMPILEYIDSTREMRTGVSRQQLGLDPKALQSTDKLAVEQSVSGAQGKIELIGRIMANGMRKLYKGILHLIVQNQDRPRMIEMNGNFVVMDPRTWRADVGVKLDVANGGGTAQQRLTSLMAIIQKQELILQTFGMEQPIVKPSQYANALRKWVELAGWRNPDMFFSEVDPNWQPAPPQPPPPDPKIVLGQQELQLQQNRLDFDKQKALWAEHRERDKNVADSILRTRQIEIQHSTTIGATAIRAAAGIHEAEINLAANHHQEVMRQEGDTHRQLLGHLADIERDAAAKADQASGGSESE